MATLRPLASRFLRPHLSPRYQHLRSHRHQSSLSTPPSFFRRNRARILWSTLALLTGLGAGNFAMHILSPPSQPQHGTHENAVLVSDLNKRIDEEFKVKVLRGKCLGVAKQLKGEEGGWVEVVHTDSDGEGKVGNGGPLMDELRGAKGLGVERIFWDRSNKKLVAVVWFGGDLSGWPGVTHGGLLATAMTEKIALAAALGHGPASPGGSAAAAPQRLPGTGNHAKMPMPGEVPIEPAQLSIDYVKPTYANNFHVIRVSPAYNTEDNVRIPVQGHEWIATLETLDTKTCVKATAKFAPRSRAEKAQEKVNEGAKWSYDQFREWMWPSRQQQSQIG